MIICAVLGRRRTASALLPASGGASKTSTDQKAVASSSASSSLVSSKKGQEKGEDDDEACKIFEPDPLDSDNLVTLPVVDERLQVNPQNWSERTRNGGDLSLCLPRVFICVSLFYVSLSLSLSFSLSMYVFLS